MADQLKDELLYLQSCISGADPHGAHERVGNIGQICLYEISPKNIDYSFSLLFDREFGVASYLRTTVDRDEFQDSKSDILEMLQTLISKYNKALLSYALDIKVACVSLFTRDKASKVKNAVIPLLIELLRLCVGSDVCKDLEVKAMIEKFMMELTKPVSKHSATVKGNLYHILGVFAELFPELMVNYSNRILETLVTNLKNEMTSKTKKPEMSIISGSLLGLTALLTNFTHSADEGAKHSYDIYKFTRMALDVSIKHTRYDMPRAALQLLSKHSCQFGRYLMDEYEKVYEILRFWSGHHNRELLHLGTSAFEAFLKQISSMLVSQAKDGRKDIDTFRFFIKKFREIMNDHTASSKSISLAIRGYGLLSAPCRVFLSTDDVRFMYTEMMQRSEQIYFGQTGNLEDKLMSLPSFLEAFSCIVMELDQMSDTFLSSLEKLVVLMVENYPRLHQKVHFICFMAIIRIYFAVGRKGAVSHGFLSRTIYQGLIRTCSHPIQLESTEKSSEADMDDEPTAGTQPRLSYRNYLPFWNALLDIATMKKEEELQNTQMMCRKELSQMGLSLEERDILSQETYDELMTAIVTMLSRFDLTSTKSSSDDVLQGGAEMASVAEEEEDVDASSDPVHGLNATKPSDFVIFINLVDFCRDILVHKKVELFQRWVYKFGREIIVYSTRNPLVSGLYKLLTVCFQICAKISYFEGLSSDELKPKQESSESMDIEMKDASDVKSDKEERKACHLLFSKFVTEVSVQTRRYRDDLLSSCLIMILALPDEILIHHLDTVTPALQRALVIGRSYLPLAKIALSTLEHWCRAFPSSLLEPRYKDVLPLLDAYLKSVEDSAADVSSATEQTSSGKRTGKKISLKVKRNRTKSKSKAEEDTELSVVRLQCVSLLGRLGGSVNNVLVTHSGCQVSKSAVAWDVEKHLKFDVPFVDLKPTIYFDPFLPRVVELATSSSDRRTKVAACELLHSLVLFMVGRGATQVTERSVDRRHCMALLFKKVFPAIMQLACDVDQVSRQLFEPLMMQLIHWFTGYKVSQSQETLTLLDAIMEGLVNSEDSALRDFSAVCLREFLKWTIKQATKEEIEKSPFSIKAMLKRFYSLARHPNAFKRLGAALGLNNIYTIFREEESLIDIFIFEMLVTFVESLAMAHADDKALGTQAQCKLVIGHLEKIIKVKAKLLCKSTKQRRKPKSWADGDLSSMLDWLLLQCGRPQTECRHSAMDLIYQLATSVPAFKTAKDFFDHHLKKSGPAYFVERFERECYKLSKGQKSGIGGLLRLKSRDKEFSLKAALNWFELVLAALDCYTWVFGQDLIHPKALFTDKGGSVLFEVLKNFVNEFAFRNLDELSRKAKGSMIFTPKENEALNQAKCTVVVRILNFFSILFGRYGKEVEQIVPGDFFTPDIWRLVIACIVEPTSIGFNMADVEVMTKLPEETSAFLSSLHRSASGLCSGFQSILIKHLKSKDMLDLRNQLPAFASEAHSDRLSLRHLVHAYIELHKAGYLTGVDSARISSAFIEHAFQAIVVKTREEELLAKHLSPTDFDLMTDCLNLGFALKPDLTKVSNLLFDKTPVKSTLSVGGSVTAHGDLFYTTFKSAIDNYLLTVAQTAVPLLVSFASKEQNVVGAILTGLLDVVSQKASLRHKHGSQLVDVLLGQWKKLSVWWQGEAASLELKSLTLTLLTKVVIVEPKAVSDVSHKSFCDVFTMYCDLLGDKNLSMAVKIRALDLLMFFVVLPEPHLTQLKNVLDRFVTDNFPTKSTEFPVGSPKYNEYTGALDKILLALELSASPVLLQLLISILCREKQHVYEETIQRTLVKTMKRQRADRQKPCLDVPFRIFLDEGSLTDDQRRSCLERVCLPLLRASKTLGLVEFFSDHIQEILSAIEAKDIRAPDSAAESQLTTKACCFLLVEIMYSCLSKDEVHSKNSRINNVYCKMKPDLAGNEMTKMLTKVANAVKSEDMRGETKHLELRRQLHCAAYNALIAVISRTQTEIKFYNGFLFSENPTKGQLLWENLIDQTRKYDFPVEMETPLVRKKKYVAIRSENRELREQQLEDDDEEQGRRRLASVHYLASQYLTESSLNTDVSQFDFGGSIALLSRSGSLSESQTGSGRLKRMGTLTRKEGSLQEQFPTSDGFVELEMDSLNQHESMASLTALIGHMNQNVKSDKDSKEMPGWMNNLLQKFSAADCHLNVKLFLVKVILNSEEVFRPFARSWMAPLIQLITGSGLGDSGINYLVNDVVVMILSWHTVYKPQGDSADRAMASHLLQFLVKHCHHDSRQVLRNNLEVLKTLVEVWRDSIDIPTTILFESFNERDPKSRRNAAGVQMVGVIVANGLLPFRACPGVDKDSFYKMLALNMTNEQKMVYSAAAEVIGMTLKLLSDASSSSSSADKEWLDQYMENVSSMMMRLIDEKRKLDNFITCVHRMQLHYPPISDRFLAKVLYVFPKVYGIFKAHCLEIIQNRIDHIPNVFLELKSKGFVDLLSQRDETTQQVSLRVVHAMLRHIKESELMILLPSLVSFASSPSAICRLVMYDIFIWIYDNYRGASGDTSDQILAKAKEILLKGLSDDDEKSRLHVHNFWTHETRLPSGTLNRLTAILEAMYSPETEDNYLSYATNFMMELTSKSPDFNREIFDQPLSECKFIDYKIQSSWYQRHAAMTPLFVETQLSTQTAIPGHGSVGANDGSVGSRHVRMTQDVTSFAPTQASVARGPYNWLTQNSLDVSSSSLMDSSFDEDGGKSLGQSSLLFTIGRSTGGKKLQSKAVPLDFGRERLGKKEKQPDEGNDGSASDILNLKKRFVKSHDDSSKVFFMKRQTRLTQQREHQQQEQRQRREHQVTMYRSYRIGDLPDIQIKHSYIIAPLQGLAQRDSTVAKLLFSSLFKAIFDEIEKEKTEREAESLVTKINQSLNEMLSNTLLFLPPFLGFILDVALSDNKKIRLDPMLVRQCCITGSIQPLGILLLEENIVRSDSAEEPQAKRARGASRPTAAPQNTSTWIELARLYKSIGEYDVVCGIFGNQLGTGSITKDAIEAEMRKDYQTATKLYVQGLCVKNEDKKDEANDLEMDFWEESRLHCYDRLGQWEKLEDACHHHLDIDPSANEMSLDVVWDSEMNQETFLPSMIRSKLKLLLSSKPQQTFLNFLDRALKNPERKTVLELKYCEELALLYVWQDDYDRANHYATMAMDIFFQDWSGLNDLMSFSRLAKLQGLQKLTELREFLLVMKTDGALQNLSRATNLVTEWTRRLPDRLLDPPSIWDDVITNRCVYTDHLMHRLKREKESSGDIFERSKVMFRLEQVDAARKQNIFSLALRLLKSTRADTKDDAELYVRWTEAYAKTHHQRAHHLSTLDPTEKIKTLSAVKDLLDKVGQKHAISLEMQRRQNQLLAETMRLAADVLMSTWLTDYSTASDEVRSTLASIAGCKASTPDEVLVSLVERGFHLSQCAVSDVKAEMSKLSVASTDAHGNLTAVQKAHMAFFHYCDRYLQQADDGVAVPLTSCPSFAQFPSAVVTSLLTAMKLDSLEARMFFPRLLQVISASPDVIQLFIKHSSEVPCWMFLGWVSQITAILDKPESLAVHDILTDIAQQYPDALVYPFKLSSESYKLDETLRDAAKIKSVINRLKEVLSKNHLIDRLICELGQFDQPNIIFKDWMSDYAALLSRKNADVQSRQHLFEDLYSRLVGRKSSSAELFDDGSPAFEFGPYWKNFQKKFVPELEKMCGRNGTNLSKMSGKEFVEKAKKILDDMVKACESTMKPPATVKDYSPWLAEFQGSLFDEEIEIPGQYTGLKKPMPEYHTKIAGFQETVLVMTSIRRPKRVVIRGNDEKDYKFLVKCGEDLRQDQRLEILFGLMNDIFNRDATCRQMSLHIRTYQVVPMTTRLGILEWMDHTVPLKQHIEEMLPDRDKILEAVKGDHFKAIGCAPKDYMASYKRLSRSDVVTAFRRRESMIPFDLLRRAYQKMSASPEAFYSLRMNFARTHSQLCICHYLLGIGDRHQSNYMIDLETGAMVGIDFGHAFGSATQFLPVPELVPFRLTRQILNLMQPLKEKGLMEGIMIHTLRALREHADILLSTMDVFIKEPSLDWKQNAERQKKQMTGDEITKLEVDELWYPKQKIEVARRKLQGDNCAHIMRSELRLGHGKMPYFRDMEVVLMGEATRNARASCPEHNLSVEQQVACLIDLATDPNILGRFWIGWEPWM